MTTRVITLPDGQRLEIQDVPDFVQDSELVSYYAPQYMQPEEEDEPELISEPDFWQQAQDFVADTGETIESMGQSAYDGVKGLGQWATNTAQDFAESTASGFATVGENMLTAVADIGSTFTSEDSDFVRGIRDQVQESREAREWIATRTADSPYASAIGNIAPVMLGYVGVGGAAFKAGTSLGLRPFSAGVTAGLVADQTLANREENLFNMFNDPLDPEDASTFLDYFAANPEEDSIAEQRLKLTVEGLVLGGTIGLFFDTPILQKMASAVSSKPWQQLSKNERVDAAMTYFQGTKNKITGDSEKANQFKTINPETGEYESIAPSNGLVAPSSEQIESQNRSFFRRLWQVGFNKEGYLPPDIFNMFEGAQAAKRQYDARIEHISNRLSIALKDIVDSEGSENVRDKVNSLLFGDYDKKGNLIRAGLGNVENFTQDDIARISIDNNLTMAVVEELVLARQLIDDLSGAITQSPIPDDKLKGIIENNIGTYFNRSYKLFENPGWVPDDALYQDTLNKYTADILQNKPEFTLAQAANQAKDSLDHLLDRGKEDSLIASHISNIRKLNKDVFLKRKDTIPEYIRKFMGEIENPTDRLMITVKKLAEFSENAQYFQGFLKAGTDGGYLHKEATGIFNTKITGTKFNKIDGMYTTPEIAKAIEGRQGRLFQAMTHGNKVPPLNSALHNMFALKGLSQKTKTIYSHVTHLRNFLGGTQFNLANGMNPFAEGKSTFRLLRNEIRHKGDKELDEMYEEYLNLGLINTNVRIQEFRKLLQEGEDYFLSQKTGQAREYIEKSKLGSAALKGLDKVDQFAEQIYMATDDFFKINGFHRELDTLIAARKQEGIELDEAAMLTLKKEAAEIIRDTFPSYDRVAPGIKGLRELPLGNFVAFPAEILRNSWHIVRRGHKELMSDNPVLQARGRNRLAGYFASASAWSGASYATAALAGLTDEEKRAVAKTAEAPWTSGEPLYFRDKDSGELHVVDSTAINSYNFVRGIFSKSLGRILEGNVSNQELTEIGRNAVVDTLKHTLGPFVSPSMYVEGLLDVTTAIASPTGRTTDGRKLFPMGMDVGEMMYVAAAEITKPFVPGTAVSLAKFANYDVLDEISGMPRQTFVNELISNTTGIKFTKVDPTARLLREFYKYQSKSREKLQLKIGYGDDPNEIIQKYIDVQRTEYRLQKDLYDHFRAAEQLIGTRETVRLLRKANVSKQRIGQLRRGMFTPTTVTDNVLRALRDKVYALDTDIDHTDHPTLRSLALELHRMARGLRKTSLEAFAEDEEDIGVRLLRAEGGLVRASQRLNPFTGMSYESTADDLFGDPLRRLGFYGGGEVRQRYAFGGKAVIRAIFKSLNRPEPENITDRAAYRAHESLEKDPLTLQDLNAPFQVSYMNKNYAEDRFEENFYSDFGDQYTIMDINNPKVSEFTSEPLDPKAQYVAIRKQYLPSEGESPVQETTMFFDNGQDVLDFYNQGNNRFDPIQGSKHTLEDAEFSREWRSEENIEAFPFIDDSAAARLASKEGPFTADEQETISKIFLNKPYQNPQTYEDFYNLLSDMPNFDANEVAFLKEHIKPVSKELVRIMRGANALEPSSVRQTPAETEFWKEIEADLGNYWELMDDFLGVQGATIKDGVFSMVPSQQNINGLESWLRSMEQRGTVGERLPPRMNESKGTYVDQFKEQKIKSRANKEKDFRRGSTHTGFVFRGTTHGETTYDALIALLNPREVGLHVGGNYGQAQSIVDPVSVQQFGTGGDQIVNTMTPAQYDRATSLRGELYGGRGIDTLYGTQLDPMELVKDPQTLAPKLKEGAERDYAGRILERDEQTFGTSRQATVAKYFINIKNPLKTIDLGTWDAQNMSDNLWRLRPVEMQNPMKVYYTMLRRIPLHESNIETKAEQQLAQDYIYSKLFDHDASLIREEMIESGIDVDGLDANINRFTNADRRGRTLYGTLLDDIEDQIGRPLSQDEWDQLEEIKNIDTTALVDGSAAARYAAQDSYPSMKDDLFGEANVFRQNRLMREWYERLGFDSIEYENTGEISIEDSDYRSWIIFNPQQIKSTTAQSFDVTDPRVGRAYGGLIRLRDKYNAGGKSMYARVSEFGEEMAAKHFDITADDLKNYTQESVNMTNRLVDKGHFPETERVVIDPESGRIDGGGDAFAAINHLRKAVLAKDSKTLRGLAQAKEVLQWIGGDRGPHGGVFDADNNARGFRYFDQAQGNKEVFNKLVEQDVIERFGSKGQREAKAEGGKVSIPQPPKVEDSQATQVVNPPTNQPDPALDKTYNRGVVYKSLQRRFM